MYKTLVLGIITSVTFNVLAEEYPSPKENYNQRAATVIMSIREAFKAEEIQRQTKEIENTCGHIRVKLDGTIDIEPVITNHNTLTGTIEVTVYANLVNGRAAMGIPLGRDVDRKRAYCSE